tara:strand:+ start:306 stop:593 length:288 start_codon:yes stop_codon:yes gene_type:complete
MPKKWKNIKPHTQQSRKKVFQKYGKRCFLESKTLKYPICNKFNGKEECNGHYGAQYYLNINIGKLKKKKDKESTKKRKKYKILKKKSLKYTKKNC